MAGRARRVSSRRMARCRPPFSCRWGTVGTVKGVPQDTLEELGVEIPD